MDFLTIAIGLGGKLIEERRGKCSRAPSETIPGVISDILGHNGFVIDDVRALIVTLGPGSFTGIRVGLAFCKGIASSKGIPLFGVPTLDVLVSPFSFLEGSYLCPLIDAKKGEVFLALYRARQGEIERLTPYQAIKPDQVADFVKEPVLLLGTGTRLCQWATRGMGEVSIAGEEFSKVSGEALLGEGLKRYAHGDAGDPLPVYCRKSEAEIKFNIVVR